MPLCGFVSFNLVPLVWWTLLIIVLFFLIFFVWIVGIDASHKIFLVVVCHVHPSNEQRISCFFLVGTGIGDVTGLLATVTLSSIRLPSTSTTTGFTSFGLSTLE